MDFDDFRDNIFPWIQRTSPLTGVPDDKEAVKTGSMSRAFLADLRIFFAIDRQDHFELLQRSMLPPEMDDEALYALAKKNLTEQVEFTLTGTSYGGLGILAGGDHEAGALCLDFIWDAVVKTVGQDLVVAVPARDCLFMAVAADPDQVAAMTEISKGIFTSGEQVLTNTLFLFNADTRNFSVYDTF